MQTVQEGDQPHASDVVENAEDNRRIMATFLYGGKPGVAAGRLIGYHPNWSGQGVNDPGLTGEMVVPILQGTREAHTQDRPAPDECCAHKVARFLMEVDAERTTIMRREPGWLSSVITTSLGTNVYD